jgi:AraC-like DNA-binding protein
MDRPELALPQSDPVAVVVRLLRPRTVYAGGLDATGAWALEYAAFAHIKLGNVVSGSCWIVLDDRPPQRLDEGDFYLLASPARYVMASDPGVHPEPAEALWDTAQRGVLRLGQPTGAQTFVRGAMLGFDDPNAALLLDALPRLVHLPAAALHDRALVRLSELLIAEVGSNEVGSQLVIDHLAQLFLIYVLRLHTRQASRAVGWLGALGDPRIGAALRAMHAEVARRWSLDELAAIANMSRSAFAAAFKARVGTTPVEYHIQWRMRLAQDALRQGTKTISQLALATGYESESAFSTAFRRVTGHSPRHFKAGVSGGGSGRAAS